MFEYFYNEVLRRTIISFGTLFNNITIKHEDSSDNVVSVVKIPLAYGPTQKFLARINQSPDLNKPFAITLPRMSFEFTGLTYDPSRKVSTVQNFTVKDPDDGSIVKKQYMPVPYNMQFELSIMSKLNDDSLQIIEQILPYFQPSLNITINLISAIGEKKDVPIVMESITQNDQYEGGFDSRRLIIHTLRFTAKTYLFGPVAESTDGLIKRVDVDYYTNTNIKTAKRVQRYTATPKALQDYNDDNATVVDGAISTKVTKIKVSASTDLTVGGRIIIGGEIMYVEKINGQDVNVIRGYDNTAIAEHEHGATVNVLNAADDALIEFGDDFGFNETSSFFTDGGA